MEVQEEGMGVEEEFFVEMWYMDQAERNRGQH